MTTTRLNEIFDVRNAGCDGELNHRFPGVRLKASGVVVVSDADDGVAHQLGAARLQGLEDPLNFRPRWRFATSGTLRLLGREACGGK